MATHVAPNVSGGETVKILTSAGDVDPNVYVVDRTERTIIWLHSKENPGMKPIKIHRQRIKEIVNMSPASTAGTAKPKFSSAADESDESATEESTAETSEESEVAVDESPEAEAEEESAEVEASELDAEAEEDESEAESDASSDDAEDKETETVSTATATATAPAPVKQAKAPVKTPTKASEPKAPKVAKPKVKKTGTPFDFSPLLAEGAEVWSKDVNFDHKDKDIKARAHTVISKDGKSYRTFNTYNGSLGKDGGGHSEFPITTDAALEKKRETLKKKGYSRLEA